MYLRYRCPYYDFDLRIQRLRNQLNTLRNGTNYYSIDGEIISCDYASDEDA